MTDEKETLVLGFIYNPATGGLKLAHFWIRIAGLYFTLCGAEIKAYCPEALTISVMANHCHKCLDAFIKIISEKIEVI